MSIKTQIAADMAATLFDDTVDETPAETVTYTAGGSGSSITAVWAAEDPSRIGDVQVGQSKLRQARCVVAAADVAAPAIGDTVTRNAEVWSVIEVDPIGQGAAFTLTLKRAEPAERAGENYRIPRFE